MESHFCLQFYAEAFHDAMVQLTLLPCAPSASLGSIMHSWRLSYAQNNEQCYTCKASEHL
eukprot:1271627-Amphidinium_carterae.1